MMNMNDLLKLKDFFRGWILESGNEILSDGNLYAPKPPPPALNVAIKLLQMESYQTLNNFTLKLHQEAPTINLTISFTNLPEIPPNER